MGAVAKVCEELRFSAAGRGNPVRPDAVPPPEAASRKQ